MRIQLKWSLAIGLLLGQGFIAPLLRAQQTEGINPQLLKTLVSVEQISGTNTADGKLQARSVGTAFLVSTPTGPTNNAGIVGQRLILVTAKHVVTEPQGTLKPNLAYRLNNRSTNSDLVPETHMQQYAGNWFSSANYDVACRFIVFGDPDVKTFSLEMFLSQKSIRPGAPVLVIGFPLGLRSEVYAVPIVRRGSVAFVDENSLMLDGFTFPGNSGGPVVYSSVLGNTVPIRTGELITGDALIGLVIASLSYTDVAVSQQTKRPRITFEENSGLTHVLPAEAILSLLQREDVREFGRRKRLVAQIIFTISRFCSAWPCRIQQSPLVQRCERFT